VDADRVCPDIHKVREYLLPGVQLPLERNKILFLVKMKLSVEAQMMERNIPLSS